jgi:glycosyltransferase involved in cell wall biosynthesis
MDNRRYAVIAPCRDEGKFIRLTLESLAKQTIPPTLLVVVDDGSTDDTPTILEEYAAKMPYLRVVRREDRGVRSVGPGVIDAFYTGFDTIEIDEFDYVCKLDLDLDLPPRYFELLIQRMEAEPRLGTTSGKPYVKDPETGAIRPEVCGDEMSVGMTKFYRVTCFKEIGGFVRQVMWDGIDCHRCRMLGWLAESVDIEGLRFIHLRPMGSSHRGIWTGRVRWGYGQYFMGTSPSYLIASAAFRLAHYPYVLGSVAMLYGYAKSIIRDDERYAEPGFREFLQRYQRECLLYGKAEATKRVNSRQAIVWEDKSSGSTRV